jgi:glycosyltransferase domain-containing protein
MVAILIPTLNRADFLLRQLRFYAAKGCKNPIYVADSSNKTIEVEKTTAGLAKLQGKLSVHHFPMPSATAMEARAFLTEKVAEPYLCWVGDDDFQNPDTLRIAEKFLKANPDYTTATGTPLAFGLNEKGAFGTLHVVDRYHQLSNEELTAARRITKYFHGYHDILNSVTSTELFRKNMKHCADIKDPAFAAEYIQNGLTMAAGKAKMLPELGFLRQTHSDAYKLPGVFDWLLSPHWQPAFVRFFDVVSKAIAETDSIEISEAQEVVRRSFSKHLQRGFAKYNLEPTVSTRALLKKVPGYKVVKRIVRKKDANPAWEKYGEYAYWLKQYPQLEDFYEILGGKGAK